MESNLLKAVSNTSKKIWASSESYVLTVFLITDLFFLLKLLGGSPWTTVAYLVIVSILLWLKLKDMVTSFFLTAIYSFQFYLPNKYYIVEVFRPYQLQLGMGSYFLGYGINLENIFLLITLLLVARNLVLNPRPFKKFNLLVAAPALVSGLLYFVVSAYSSIFFSPYETLSLTWLMQYMQIFFVALTMFYIFINGPRHLKFISTVALASIALQSTIAIVQFIKQSWIGLPIESARGNSVFFGSIDAVDSLFRVIGSFGQSNQLSLIIAVLLVIILPVAIENKKPIYLAGSVMAFATILLTQSRSGWIALVLISIIILITYRHKLLKIVQVLGIRRSIITTALVILATSVVVISRLLVSFNAFYEGAGIPLRVEMIKEAGLAISQNFWIGYGVGTNEPTLLRLFPKGYNYTFPAPVHNGYVQLLLESGMLGLIFFLLPCIFIVRGIINQYLIRGIKKMAKFKNYTFITLGGITAFAMFYIAQPYEGFRDFAYLGLVLGYGLVCLQNFKSTPK